MQKEAAPVCRRRLKLRRGGDRSSSVQAAIAKLRCAGKGFVRESGLLRVSVLPTREMGILRESGELRESGL